MLIILPDPTTRRCLRHRDELMTDSISCPRCEGERISREFTEGIRDALRVTRPETKA